MKLGARRLAPRRLATLWALPAILTTGACGTAASPDPTREAMSAIVDVTIVDVIAGETVSGQTLLIEGERIARIGPAEEIEIPVGVRVIAGDGLHAVPGLVDLHTHIVADDLVLFLANGVTTIREMNGTDEHLRLREAIERGERPGPTMHVTGSLLAGVEQQWRHLLVGSAAEGRAEVLADHEAGFDVVKVYDGLSAETYGAIVTTAAELDMPVIGHVPEAVGLGGVIDAGQLSIEHVEQIVNTTVGHDLDATRIPEIVRRIQRGSSAVTPTIAAMEILSARRTAWFDGLYERPEMRYAPPDELGWWASLREPPERREATPDTVVGGRNDWIEFQRALTLALADAGVPILVGTDTPNPLLVPGFSLHHELEALVRAGLAPDFVLRAATHEAARHLGVEGDVGALRPGLRADIVLVDGNPLEDLARLRAVEGIVVRGAWHPRDRLDAWLADVAARRAP